MVETTADFYGDSYNAAIRQRLGSVSPTALYMEAEDLEGCTTLSRSRGGEHRRPARRSPLGTGRVHRRGSDGQLAHLLEEANARGAMTVDIRPIPRPGGIRYRARVSWASSVGSSCGRRRFFVAQLRFAEHATIHPHAGERDTIVVCIEGEGFTSVGGRALAAARGSAGALAEELVHGLWTEGSTMTTLMIERLD